MVKALALDAQQVLLGRLGTLGHCRSMLADRTAAAASPQLRHPEVQ